LDQSKLAQLVHGVVGSLYLDIELHELHLLRTPQLSHGGLALSIFEMSDKKKYEFELSQLQPPPGEASSSKKPQKKSKAKSLSEKQGCQFQLP